MIFLNGIHLGLLEIWGNKFRSFLTMLGIILGVAALVSMIGILEGYFHNSQEWIVATGGLEKIEVNADPVPKDQEHLAGISPGRTVRDADAIAAVCDLVAHVSPEIGAKHKRLVRKGKTTNIYDFVGVRGAALKVNNYDLDRGRMIGDLDLERFAQVVVIGTWVKRNLFEPNEEVLGKVIQIEGLPFTIVGILAHYEKGYKDKNWMEWKNKIAYIPLTTMQRKVMGRTDLTGLNVEVADVARLAGAVEQVENTLLRTHRGIRDFRVDTKREMVERWAAAQNTVLYAMGGVAAISLLIGGIGITYVMLASINERIREIGIRKAVGARPRDIFTQFIAEAVALSVLGGLLGLLASAGMIEILKIALSEVELVPTLSPRALLIGFSFSASMGIFAGIYPALRASRLDPIDALRYE